MYPARKGPDPQPPDEIVAGPPVVVPDCDLEHPLDSQVLVDDVLVGEGLLPHRVEVVLPDGCLVLAVRARVREEVQLDKAVRQALLVHDRQLSSRLHGDAERAVCLPLLVDLDGTEHDGDEHLTALGLVRRSVFHVGVLGGGIGGRRAIELILHGEKESSLPE